MNAVANWFLTTLKTAMQNKHTSIAAFALFAFAVAAEIWPERKETINHIRDLAIIYGLLRAGDGGQQNPPGQVVSANMKTLLVLVGMSCVLFGCAVNKQSASITETGTNGVIRTSSAKCVTWAMGDAKATVDSSRASAGKTASVGAKGESSESTTGNFATNANAVLGLINAIKTP